MSILALGIIYFIIHKDLNKSASEVQVISKTTFLKSQYINRQSSYSKVTFQVNFLSDLHWVFKCYAVYTIMEPHLFPLNSLWDKIISEKVYISYWLWSKKSQKGAQIYKYTYGVHIDGVSELSPRTYWILPPHYITLPTKVLIVKAMVFPVVMYGCENWTIKKAECQRIDAFKLWCWRRLLRVPWTARRSNKSILKEISPEYSLEGLMLRVKLQYFGWLIQRANSLEKTLMLGKTEGRRRRGLDSWMASLTQWMWVWASFQR